MTLYHGSNVEVGEPKILKPNRGLDFGIGFYTTTNHDQAVAFAKRVTRNRGTGSATVSVYEVDEVTAFQVCDVVRFDGVCDAWLDFVCDNRDGAYAGPRYDLAFGPVANDDVYRTLYLFLAGEIDREETFKSRHCTISWCSPFRWRFHSSALRARRCLMCDRRHSALLTVIVPMVVAEIVRGYGLDETTATEQFYASRVYDELSDEGKKLWHYSPKVLFAMYDEEKRTGTITYPEEAF